jgi:hypothetical protein
VVLPDKVQLDGGDGTNNLKTPALKWPTSEIWPTAEKARIAAFCFHETC